MVIDLRLGDCLELMPATLDRVKAVITDPPYGMHKADWDLEVPKWLHLVGNIPTVCFCGIVGMRDYPIPDWIGAWVRQGSTQRNGRLRGFNNWEPLLFYNIQRLENDVFNFPNYHEDTGHPTTKPTKLMEKLIERMTKEGDTVLDPFMGSGTTGVACVKLNRNFIGFEINPDYFRIAEKRIADAQKQMVMELA